MPRRRLSCLLCLTAFVAFTWGCPPGARDIAPSEDAIARQNNLGVAWLGQQNWIEAEKALREGLAAAPRDPVLLVNLSIALVQQGRADEARQALEQALEQDEQSLHARYDLGLLARSDGRLDEAIEHFDAVREADPHDVPNLYNLAAALAANGDDARAEETFREALRLNPVHTSANYGLGRLLVSRGDGEEGRRLITLSQELRARSGVDDSVGNRYGEQGYYALGLDWPGARLAPPPPAALEWGSGHALDGPVEAWTAGRFGAEGEPGATVVVASRGRLLALGPGAGGAARPFGPAPPGSEILALAAGDVSGDGSLEIVAVTPSGTTALALLVLDRAGRGNASWRVAAPTGARVDAGGRPREVALALVDRDHDGDLDALACWAGTRGTACHFATHGKPGQLAFDDDERGIVPGGPAAAGPLSVSFSDIDLDRDIDMLVGDSAGVRLYANRRDGTFDDRSVAAGLGETLAGTRAFDVADMDRDGRFDVLAASAAGVQLCRSERHGAFHCERIHDRAADGVVALDADGDGFLDVATGERDGPLVLLGNRGADGFAPMEAGRAASGVPLLALDLDGDLDPDLLTRDGGGLRLVTNEAGTGHARLAVLPRGVRDNRFGIGTRIEALAGAWRQRVEIRRPLPALFATGSRRRVDAVRLVWPGGVLQDEIGVEPGREVPIEQLDRKGTSCPLLYAWQDGAWRFITDFLGGSAVGYRLDEATFNMPDTDEYVRIDGGLDDDGGTLRLRLNNQLEEVIWLDAAELVVVDHPQATEVFPHERLMPGPPWPEFRLFASPRVEPVRGARVPSDGRDVTERLAVRDRRVVGGFPLLPYKGYAALHELELDLGAVATGERLVLLLDGWIDYADSSANVAAAQAGIALQPPRLLVPDGDGGWRVAIERMGFPAGLPKTMTVPLTGLVDPRDPRVRIETSMRIYWDRARVMHGGDEISLAVERLEPRTAVLRDGGLPRPFRPDGRLPDVYDPDDVVPISPWKAHAGAYTAFGDVRDALLAVDDAFVTTRSGDEIELAFDAPPGPGPGMSRTYFLYADGFGKDMDPASGAPDTVGPIPWHDMPHYPYGAEARPPARARTGDARLVTPSADGLHGAASLPLAGRPTDSRAP